MLLRHHSICLRGVPGRGGRRSWHRLPPLALLHYSCPTYPVCLRTALDWLSLDLVRIMVLVGEHFVRWLLVPVLGPRLPRVYQVLEDVVASTVVVLVCV